MKIKLSFFIGVSLHWLAFIPLTSAFEVYISTDKNGKQVYSDTPPARGKFKKLPSLEIKTVEWIETPKIKRPKVKRPQSNQQNASLNNDKNGRCKKLKKTISSVEKSLNQGQEAAKFDTLKSRLIKLRWRYRSDC